jgi:hypothetical protein
MMNNKARSTTQVLEWLLESLVLLEQVLLAGDTVVK